MSEQQKRKKIKKNPKCAFVISVRGKPLMPMFNWRRIRKKLKSGEAVITGHNPFTIQLAYESGEDTQDIEFKEDTGEAHIGISVCSEKHEFAHEEYEPLTDEKVRHDDQRRLRRSRRNRKRHRKARFDNRRRNEGWLAPTVRHKKDNNVKIYEKYHKVCPITKVFIEVGSFDTQALEATEAGRPLPEGTDYQHGLRFGYDNLREAVFARDGYECICCGSKPGFIKKPDGKYIQGKVILRMHHLGFKTGDHTDRMSNLATVCTRCHTPAAHKPGGKLYELEPKLKTFKGAAFMNSVRWLILSEIKAIDPTVEVKSIYGCITKRKRHHARIPKSHANDAYCMGKFHPKHRTKARYFKKARRNDRRLQKFYDAVYIDTRTEEKVKANSLGYERTKRSEPRRSNQNLRHYRGKKISKGRLTVKKQRTVIKPGTEVLYNKQLLTVHGTHTNKGNINVEFETPARDGKKSASLKKVKIVKPMLIQAWEEYSTTNALLLA